MGNYFCPWAAYVVLGSCHWPGSIPLPPPPRCPSPCCHQQHTALGPPHLSRQPSSSWLPLPQAPVLQYWQGPVYTALTLVHPGWGGVEPFHYPPPPCKAGCLMLACVPSASVPGGGALPRWLYSLLSPHVHRDQWGEATGSTGGASWGLVWVPTLGGVGWPCNNDGCGYSPVTLVYRGSGESCQAPWGLWGHCPLLRVHEGCAVIRGTGAPPHCCAGVGVRC